MSETSLAHSAHPEPEDLEHVGAIVARSTRHLVTDPRFAAILEEDFGIDTETILEALEGEPQKASIAICEWAAKADDPARALTNWAKKRRKGSYRSRARAVDPGRRERNAALAKAFLDRFGLE